MEQNIQKRHQSKNNKIETIMKTNFRFLLYLIALNFMITSCTKESYSLEEDSNQLQELTLKDPCPELDGPACGSPDSVVEFSLSQSDHSGSPKWKVEEGEMVQISPQGFRTAKFRLGANFEGGEVSAVGSDGICKLRRKVFKCEDSNCGLSISRVYELNGLGQNEVLFYVIPTTQPKWKITSSTFLVTLDSGITSSYFGSTLPNGTIGVQIPVLCNPKSGRVDKVVAVVYASNGIESCSRSVETDFLSVCGTGGGFGGF